MIEKPYQRGVTWRAVLIGLILIPPVAYWVMLVEGIWHTGHPSCISLPWGVVFPMLVVIALNLGVRLFSKKWALTQGELITIYAMLCMAVSLSGHDSLQLGVPALCHAYWFATPANRWDELITPYLPKWCTVWDKEILKGFYSRGSSLYIYEHLLVWGKVVLWWSLFILALGAVMISINVLLRKQWTENEKLGYPIIQLPLAITKNGGASPFFKQKCLWIGFGMAALLNITNGLSKLYPFIPYIRVRHDEFNLGTYFVGYPWSGVGWLPVPFYPFLIALGYLIPLDLSFSMWFFYLLRKGMLIISAIYGVRSSEWTFGQPPYLNEQSYGAWFVLVAVVLWRARRHLKEAIKVALLGRGSIDDSSEPMRYRSALIIMLISLSFLFWFSRRMGFSWWFIPAFFAFYFLVAIGITRIRAELGPPAHEVVGLNAENFFVSILGTKRLGERNLVPLTLFWWFCGRGYRTQPMPYQLEAFKMAEEVGVNPRGMGVVLIFSMWVGGLAAYWAALHLQYKEGINPLIDHNWGKFTWVAAKLSAPWPPNYKGMFATACGAAATSFMFFMRSRFMWWPLHPAGYALSMNFGVEYFWSCLVVASIIKALVLRYGGYDVHRKVIPLMFGVILGEYTVGAFWSAMSIFLKRSIYDFAPG